VCVRARLARDNSLRSPPRVGNLFEYFLVVGAPLAVAEKITKPSQQVTNSALGSLIRIQRRHELNQRFCFSIHKKHLRVLKCKVH
jgi:hypothetical protein